MTGLHVLDAVRGLALDALGACLGAVLFVLPYGACLVCGFVLGVVACNGFNPDR